MSFNKEKPRVAIIGSGVGGLSTAIALKKQLNFENFLIFEKQSDVGGTWRDNTYPGCSSDVAGHWYCLSTEPNPNWSSFFVLQPEILAYWQSLVSKYALQKHIVFNTSVVRAVWDDAAQLYHLTLRDEKTGVEREEVVEALVSASGGFSEPHFPDNIPGIKDFKGPMFHSAQWQQSVDLAGKTVGVVGNAASAAQLIPRISTDPTVKVVNFCRTPNWYIPRANYKYPSWVKWAFAHVPGVMLTYRTYLFARYDIVYLVFRNSHKRLQAFGRKLLTKEIKKRAPKEYVDKLIPSYPPGCRRIIIDPGYLKSLHQPNVSLSWDGIERFESGGIITKTGETIPLDVVVFATGFYVCKLMVDVRGRSGTSLQEYYDSQGGPTAYLGTTIPGFPNFFMILGPNIATGHASVIFSEESQIAHILQLLGPILTRSASSFTVRADVTDEFNTAMQARLNDSVFAACTSYYRAGADGAGKNVAIWPGPVLSFWWRTRKVRWEDYEARGAEKWVRERSRERGVKLLLFLVTSVFLAAGAQPGVRSAALAIFAPVVANAYDLISYLTSR